MRQWFARRSRERLGQHRHGRTGKGHVERSKEGENQYQQLGQLGIRHTSAGQGLCRNEKSYDDPTRKCRGGPYRSIAIRLTVCDELSSRTITPNYFGTELLRFIRVNGKPLHPVLGVSRLAIAAASAADLVAAL